MVPQRWAENAEKQLKNSFEELKLETPKYFEGASDSTGKTPQLGKPFAYVIYVAGKRLPKVAKH